MTKKSARRGQHRTSSSPPSMRSSAAIQAPAAGLPPPLLVQPSISKILDPFDSTPGSSTLAIDPTLPSSQHDGEVYESLPESQPEHMNTDPIFIEEDDEEDEAEAEEAKADEHVVRPKRKLTSPVWKEFKKVKVMNKPGSAPGYRYSIWLTS